MNICKCTGLAVIGVIALSACSRQESVADAQKHADAAAIKGGERVMEAQRDAANAEIKAGEAVAKAEDKAVAQVDSAQASAQTSTTARARHRRIWMPPSRKLP